MLFLPSWAASQTATGDPHVHLFLLPQILPKAHTEPYLPVLASENSKITFLTVYDVDMATTYRQIIPINFHIVME